MNIVVEPKTSIPLFTSLAAPLRTSPRKFVPVVFLLVTAFIGCSQATDRPRVVVSGSVTYDGQPVVKGRIRFEPLPGTTGNLSVGVIDQGRYMVDDFGGVPVGRHRVKILSFDPDDPGGGPGGPPQKQFLPAKYNYQSTLEASIEPTPARAVHDFQLEK